MGAARTLRWPPQGNVAYMLLIWLCYSKKTTSDLPADLVLYFEAHGKADSLHQESSISALSTWDRQKIADSLGVGTSFAKREEGTWWNEMPRKPWLDQSWDPNSRLDWTNPSHHCEIKWYQKRPKNFNSGFFFKGIKKVINFQFVILSRLLMWLNPDYQKCLRGIYIAAQFHACLLNVNSAEFRGIFPPQVRA